MVDKILSAVSPIALVEKLNEIIDELKKAGGSYLLHHEWADAIVNDLNWLRADTFSWQDGTVYSNAYNHLVDDLGEQETTTYYFWKLGMGGYWTTSETPSVGDTAYTIAYPDMIPSIYTVEEVVSETKIKIDGDTHTRDSSGDRTVTDYANKITENIGSYYISYYLAEDGHRICLPDQETTALNIYNESGVAWYYILDTANQRFKLPRTKYGFVGLRDAVGKYAPESLPNIKASAVLSGVNITSEEGAFGAAGIGSAYTGSYGSKDKLTFDASNSSSVYQDNAPVQQRATQMYLYFYVGQFSQSATEQTAGLNSELFNGKADVDLSNAAPNASASAKEIIVGWGLPDFTRGVSRSAGSSNSPNVAATDCLVCFAGNSTTNDGGGASLYVYNGSSFVRVSGGMGSGLNTLNIAGNCILPKGTNYYIGCAVFQYCYEFPLKGV